MKTDFRGGFARPAVPATKSNVGEAILTQKEAFGWFGIRKGLNPTPGGHWGQTHQAFYNNVGKNLRDDPGSPIPEEPYYNNGMIELSIPGRGIVRLEHLVCDVNGTLAVDGRLIDGVSRGLSVLRDRLAIHLLTADTFGSQALIDQRLNMTAVRLEPAPITAEAGHEARQKLAYVEQLGAERVVAIGQGANDALMLRAAVIGICVQNSEGTAIETLTSADLVAPSILAALEMLEKPLRLVATLRK